MRLNFVPGFIAVAILACPMMSCKMLSSHLKAENGSTATPELAINFSGKGTLAGYDIGMMETLLQRSKPGTFDNAMFVGNSSGSLLAAYFSCYGVTTETIERAKQAFFAHASNLVNDSSSFKTKKFIAGNRTDDPSDEFFAFVQHFLTQPDGKVCTPRSPLIINATNGDLVDKRVFGHSLFGSAPTGPAPLKSANNRYVDPTTLRVFETEEDGKPTRMLGKACTNFVDSKAAGILGRIKEDERTCDIRPMTTGLDLVMAVVTSVSEPALFYPVVATDFNNPPLPVALLHGALGDPIWQRLFYRDLVTEGDDPTINLDKAQMGEESVADLGGDVGLARVQARFNECKKTVKEQDPLASCLVNAQYGLPANNRFYIGGFIVTAQAEQLKKVLPNMVVMGSGRSDLSAGSSKIFQLWFTADATTAYKHQRWSLDWEAYPWTAEATEMRFQSDRGLAGVAQAKQTMIDTWNSLMNVDVNPSHDNFEKLIDLRRQVSYQLGKVTTDYCLFEGNGASPNVINPQGVEEKIPGEARRARARDVVTKLGFQVRPEQIAAELQSFATAGPVKELLQLVLPTLTNSADQ